MAPSRDDEIAAMIERAEANLISTTPGAVAPHVDDGGHLPFGGTGKSTSSSGAGSSGAGGVVKISGAEFDKNVQSAVQDFEFGTSAGSVGVLSNQEGNEKESYEHLSLKNMSVSCYKNAKVRREMKLFGFIC